MHIHRVAGRVTVAPLVLLLVFAPGSLLASATPATPGGGLANQLINQQGGAEGAASGDFIAASGGGALDAPYFYFVEVPVSATRLVIDLFDPDIGNGGGADFTGQRDRDRAGYNSAATYTLTNPFGTAVTTTFTTGDAAGPGNNAWTNFFDSAAASVASPQFVSAVSEPIGDTDDVSSLTLATPGGVATGDLLLAILQKDGNAGDIVPNVPADWTEIGEGACGGDECRVGVFYRVVEAGEPATHVFNFGDTDDTLGTILHYTGVDTTNPIDASLTAPGTSATPTAPAVNTTTANTRVVRLYGADDDDFTAHPGGHTGRFVDGTGDEDDRGTAGADTPQAAIGTTNTAAFTLGGSEGWFAATVALRSASPTGDPLPGHWRVSVDMSDDAGNDINGFGIRAHDGNTDTTGTELNLYARSYYQIGVHPVTDATRLYDLHPYVTSGCSTNANNFDFDDNNTDNGVNTPPFGSLDVFARTNTFVGDEGGTMSNNNVWARDTFTGWSSSSISDDYGIWNWDATIEIYDFVGNQGNYGVFYAGAFNVDGTATPTAQPETNSYRIYVPRDGGAAPQKPYLAQQITYVSGPNPPQQNQTTRFAVTLRMVNPTLSIGDITFSNAAGNVVTANVPASNANANITFEGVQVGTAVSDPGVGDTDGGNVVWDPGTVSVNSTEILAYFIDVEPLVAATSIPVTGVPGTGNGTRALFVDETCSGASCTGTQLTTATFTFGEICELSINTNAATSVLITELEAREDAGGVMVEWETAAQAGTVGFDVYRWNVAAQEYVKVNDALLYTDFHAPQGAKYRLRDESASANEPQTYYVVEHESNGGQQTYGPFDVEVDWERDDERPPMSARYEVVPRGAADGVAMRNADSVRKKVSRASAASTLVRAESEASVPPTGARLLVEETGLYKVPASQIATALKMSQTRVRLGIATGRFTLTNGGQPVAWTPMPGSAGIQFFGQAIDSSFSAHNVYYLESRNGGVPFGAVAGSGPPAAPGTSFVDTVSTEVDFAPAVLIPLDPLGDIWFWSAVNPAGNVQLPIDAPTPRNDGSLGTLEVALQGGAPGSHNVGVQLNNVTLGNAVLTDHGAVVASFDVPAGLLLGANDKVRLTHQGGGQVLIDRFDMTYQRRYRALDDELLLRADGNSVVTVSGFTSPDTIVLDVSDPRNPSVLAGVTRDVDPGDSSDRVSFTAAGSDVPYLVSAANRVPQAISDYRSSLKSSRNVGEHLIITSSAMVGAAGELSDYRRSQGLSGQVIDVADIYDEFNYGIPSPLAIRDFLTYALANWRTPPRYVALAGDGSYDYRNVTNNGDSVVPPLLVLNDTGVENLVVSDSALGDTDGDGVPEVAIGRIPALDAAELLAYLTKLQAYESGLASPTTARVTFASDNSDNGGAFELDSEALSELLPAGYLVQSIDLANFPTTLAARQAMIDAINSGTALTNFLGHGGFDQLATEGLLRAADLPALTNYDQPTVLVASTCHINNFGISGFDSFGEGLLLAQGGAVAAWAPAALSLNTRAALLADRLFRNVFQQGGSVLGDAILDALAKGLALGIPSDTLRIYSLLGDPATILPLAPEPLPDCSETPEGCAPSPTIE